MQVITIHRVRGINKRTDCQMSLAEATMNKHLWSVKASDVTCKACKSA